MDINSDAMKMLVKLQQERLHKEARDASIYCEPGRVRTAIGTRLIRLGEQVSGMHRQAAPLPPRRRPTGPTMLRVLPLALAALLALPAGARADWRDPIAGGSAIRPAQFETGVLTVHRAHRAPNAHAAHA